MGEADPDPDPADAIATRLEAPMTSRRRPGTSRGSVDTLAEPTRDLGRGPASVSASRLDDPAFQTALRQAEIVRARKFVPILLAMLAVAVVFLAFVGGDPTAKYILFAGVAVSAVTITYLLALTRTPHTFTETRLALIYAVCMVGFHTGVYFWGVFSPVAAIGALGIFFLGVGRAPHTALLLYLLCVV